MSPARVTIGGRHRSTHLSNICVETERQIILTTGQAAPEIARRRTCLFGPGGSLDGLRVIRYPCDEHTRVTGARTRNLLRTGAVRAADAATVSCVSRCLVHQE